MRMIYCISVSALLFAGTAYAQADLSGAWGQHVSPLNAIATF